MSPFGDPFFPLDSGNGCSISRDALQRSAVVRTQGLESLDFDLHESLQYLEYMGTMTKRVRIISMLCRFSFLIVVGVFTGCIGMGIDFSVKHMFEWRCHTVDVLIENGHNVVLQYIVYVSTCLILASVAAYLVCYVEPLAAGSGIPEIKCYLNGVDIPGVCDLRTLFSKVLGVLFSVSAGLPCGKEGPMIHSGAIVGASSAACGLHNSWMRGQQVELEMRDFVTCGACAGVAAAFGAPLGGVLFAMEEGSSFWSPRTMLRSFLCAACAAFTVSWLLVGIEDDTHWGWLGAAAPLSFGHFGRATYRLWEMAIFASMGILGGLGGALFNAVNTRLTRWRMVHIGSTGRARFLEVLSVTAVVASISFALPVLFQGESVPTESLSVEALLFRSPGTESIKTLFHKEHPFDRTQLLLFGCVYYTLACWTYGLGVPSGLFVPSLLSGAAFGRLLGHHLHRLPEVVAHGSSPGVYALIGAVAALSGMARITISLAVILIEATGDTTWSLPIFLTVFMAKFTGDLFNQGLYDIHIGLRHIPVLHPFAERQMLRRCAEDVMTQPVAVLEPIMTVRQLMRVLESNNHQGYPVVSGDKHFGGLVKRSTVHHVLLCGRDSGVYVHQNELWSGHVGPFVPYKEILRRRAPFPSLQEIRACLRWEDYDKLIDLRPYMSSGSFTVPENAALTRVYMLFRTMGLRHLPVVSRGGRLAGIITRKDLILSEDHDACEVVSDLARLTALELGMSAATEALESEFYSPPHFADSLGVSTFLRA